jgi:anthranilate phosphoribosyltransferase
LIFREIHSMINRSSAGPSPRPPLPRGKRMIRECISKAVEKKDLTAEETRAVWEEITGGSATPAQIASLITALRMKGETVEEITAAAQVMRQKATRIRVDDPSAPEPGTETPSTRRPLLDTCGTGGDMTRTFNVSTCAAFVVAGAGTRVAKHGNRSVSSSCGSADVCEALGIRLTLAPDKVAECIRTHGIGFLFAPALHGTMKHAVVPRKEIGIRTIFNLLGPLSNPAGAEAQILGVYRPELTRVLAEVLGRLECRRALVVHGEDGMDEITTTGKTHICELRDGRLSHYVVHPEDFGLPLARMEDLRGADARENARILREILQGSPGPRRDMVLLNAGAALYTAGAAAGFEEGIRQAVRSIDDGKAMQKLERLIEFSIRHAPLEGG